jgi:spore coat polysaccharide biosynthesis protein SpsF (cytidylyltransferase family)
MKLNRAGAVVQARLTSKRFPGKVLRKLGEESILELILKTLSKSRRLNKIVLAVPGNEENHSITNGINNTWTYLGDEKDVMGRIIEAARTFNIDPIVRICADSPFILPWLIDYGLDVFSGACFDYLVTYDLPVGQNIEIVRLAALEQAYRKASPFEKEHVTLYFERHPRIFNIKVLDISLAVDTPDDLKRLKKIYKYYA